MNDFFVIFSKKKKKKKKKNDITCKLSPKDNSHGVMECQVLFFPGKTTKIFL